MEDILPTPWRPTTSTCPTTTTASGTLDIQEHPERYLNKTVTMKVQAMTSSKLPKGTFIPGRNAMTCCVEDIRFFGFLCKY